MTSNISINSNSLNRNFIFTMFPEDQYFKMVQNYSTFNLDSIYGNNLPERLLAFHVTFSPYMIPLGSGQVQIFGEFLS